MKRFFIFLILIFGCLTFFNISYCANYVSYNGSFDFYNTFIDIAQLTGGFNSTGFNNLTNFVDLLKDPTTSFILRGYRTNSGTDLYAYVYYSDLAHTSFDNTIDHTYFNCKNTILYQYMNRPSVNSYNSLSTTNQTSTNLRVDSSNSYTNKFYFLKLGNSYYYYLTGIYANYLPVNTSVPKFTPISNDGYVSVNNNGVIANIPRLRFSYTGQRYYKLGTLSNYKDNDDFYNLEGYFGPYVSSDVIDSTMSSFHFDYENGVLNGSLVFDYSTGEIYIKATKLIDLQTYNLLLQYSAYNGQYQDIGSFDYYATYYTTNVLSGDLISPDLNNDADIGFVNALDDFFNNTDLTNQNNQYILNNNFPSINFSGDSSGDYVVSISGDFFGVTYNDNDHWGFGDLVFWFIKSFINMLTNYDNVVVNFGFLGNINSSIFLINNSTINTFISLFSNTLFIIILIFYYFKLVHSVSTLDFEKLQNFEVDNFFNMF